MGKYRTFDPLVCSSPLDRHPNCADEKRAWLQRHFAPYFGHSVVNRAVIVHDKTTCDGVALVDDKSVIRGSNSPKWQHIVFDKPYNRDSASVPRLYGWRDTTLSGLVQAARHNYMSFSR